MGALILVGKKDKMPSSFEQEEDKEEDKEEGKEEDTGERKIAAKEIMDAFESKDVDALDEALAAFFDICQMKEEE